jgi:SET domain-containing protein
VEDPKLEIRQTLTKGRGVFALEPIAMGRRILAFEGHVLATADLTDDLLAMQIDDDLWLCSDGSRLDDCVNHSCDPNAGFQDGEAILYALRDIETSEEITWDYSTSIGWPGWTLECRCGSARCREVVRQWGELQPEERARLRGNALRYLQHRSS